MVKPNASDEEVRVAVLGLIPRFVAQGEFARADRFKLFAYEVGATRDEIERAALE